MVRGAQQRIEIDRVSGRIRCLEEIKIVGPIATGVGNLCRVLHQLLSVVSENKVVGLFTRLIREKR